MTKISNCFEPNDDIDNQSSEIEIDSTKTGVKKIF
jgi:hypothetical protein